MKVGDLVQVYTSARDKEERTLPAVEGIVTEITKKQVLFSEKYAITETETSVHVLSKGTIHVFYLEDDLIEVLSESG